MNPYYLLIFVSLGVFFAAIVIIENTVKMTFRKISVTIVASIIGLVIGSLMAFPISKLPGILGELMPLSFSIISVLAMVILFNRNEDEVEQLVDLIYKFLSGGQGQKHFIETPKENDSYVDSSALIDGRLDDVVEAGFINQSLIIPKFILNELQQIADSKDGDRRAIGRRGLDVVARIQKNKRGVRVIIEDVLLDKSEAADHKLIELSKRVGANLITTDYNLNKLAVAQGVDILNINDLAKGLRMDFLPGESLKIRIVHLGKDSNQGVGYTSDGTMIIVEKAGAYLGKELEVRVSRSIQTTAGKMYFAKILGKNGNSK